MILPPYRSSPLGGAVPNSLDVLRPNSLDVLRAKESSLLSVPLPKFLLYVADDMPLFRSISAWVGTIFPLPPHSVHLPVPLLSSPNSSLKPPQVSHPSFV